MYFYKFDRMISHLNYIVNQCTSFKIGKTSNPETRHNSPDYKINTPTLKYCTLQNQKDMSVMSKPY